MKEFFNQNISDKVEVKLLKYRNGIFPELYPLPEIS